MAASLLVECRGSSQADLEARIAEVQNALRKSGLPLGAKASGAPPPLPLRGCRCVSLCVPAWG